MRQETSDQAIQGRNLGFIALAALTAAVALLVGGKASAGNDFANGFEDELGRIVAHTAVGAGLQILSGGYYPAVVPVPVAPVVHANYYGPDYYGPRYGPHYGPYYGPRKVVVKHAKWHRHGRHCGSGHGHHGRHYGYRDGGGYDRYDRYDDDRGHGRRNRGGRGRDW